MPVDEKDFYSFLGDEVVCHADPCSDGVRCMKRSHFHRQKKPKTGAQRRIAEKPVDKAKEKPPPTQIRARKCPRTVADCPQAECHHHALKRGKKKVSDDLESEVDVPDDDVEDEAQLEPLELPEVEVKLAPKARKGKHKKVLLTRPAVVTRHLGELLTTRLTKFFNPDSLVHIPQAVGIILSLYADDDAHVQLILTDDDMFIKEMGLVSHLMREYYGVELAYDTPSVVSRVGGGPASGPSTILDAGPMASPAVPSPVTASPTPDLKPATVTLGDEEKKTLPLGEAPDHVASSVPVATLLIGDIEDLVPRLEPERKQASPRTTVMQILCEANAVVPETDPRHSTGVRFKPPPPPGPPPVKMALVPLESPNALPSKASAPSTQPAPVAAPLGPEQGACTQMVPCGNPVSYELAPTSSLVTVFFFNGRGEDKAFTRIFTKFLAALPLINQRTELHPISVIGSVPMLPHTEGHQIAVRSGLYFGRRNAYNPHLFTEGNVLSQYEVAFLEKFGFTTRRDVYIFDELFDYLLNDASTASISVLRADGQVNETSMNNLRYGCATYKRIKLLHTLSREKVDNTVIAAFQQRLIAAHRMRSAMGRQAALGRPLNSG